MPQDDTPTDTNITADNKRRDKAFLTDMTEEARKAWAEQIMDRMMRAWNIKGTKEVAKMIGCHEKMPRAWVNKGAIPWNVIYFCHLETGTSLDWLYEGKMLAATATPDVKAQLTANVENILSMSITMNQFVEVSPLSSKAVAKTLVSDFLRQYKP